MKARDSLLSVAVLCSFCFFELAEARYSRPSFSEEGDGSDGNDLEQVGKGFESMTDLATGLNPLSGNPLMPIAEAKDILKMLKNSENDIKNDLAQLTEAPDKKRLQSALTFLSQSIGKVETFVKLQELLSKHADIIEYRKNLALETQKFLNQFRENTKNNVYGGKIINDRDLKALLEMVYEGREINYPEEKTSLQNNIQNRLHMLLIYELSKPAGTDNQRGNLNNIKTYLTMIAQLRKIESSTPLFVDTPFPYGDDSIRDKTPLELAQQNGHKACQTALQEFLDHKGVISSPTSVKIPGSNPSTPGNEKPPLRRVRSSIN